MNRELNVWITMRIVARLVGPTTTSIPPSLHSRFPSRLCRFFDGILKNWWVSIRKFKIGTGIWLLLAEGSLKMKLVVYLHENEESLSKSRLSCTQISNSRQIQNWPDWLQIVNCTRWIVDRNDERWNWIRHWLQDVHDTFHVSNLKKCLTDTTLVFSRTL